MAYNNIFIKRVPNSFKDTLKATNFLNKYLSILLNQKGGYNWQGIHTASFQHGGKFHFRSFSYTFLSGTITRLQILSKGVIGHVIIGLCFSETLCSGGRHKLKLSRLIFLLSKHQYQQVRYL